jgi:hypothetical protein
LGQWLDAKRGRSAGKRACDVLSLQIRQHLYGVRRTQDTTATFE